MGLGPNQLHLTDVEAKKAQHPSVHFGRIASSDQVMKSGQHRDQIATDERVLGFEMESAGAWDYIPTIVIKGVCDYADSHKNKLWQHYASATAASCTRAVLEEWRSVDRSAPNPLSQRDRG
jgi:nucleoside phosphorylase